LKYISPTITRFAIIINDPKNRSFAAAKLNVGNSLNSESRAKIMYRLTKANELASIIPVMAFLKYSCNVIIAAIINDNGWSENGGVKPVKRTTKMM
jgi:hypothetical protein